MAEAMSPEERGRLGAEKRWGKKPEVESQIPKYRITAICYNNDRIYDPALQPLDENGDPKPLYMEYEGVPAYYMEPANAAAQAMWDQHQPKEWVDPINVLTRLSTDRVT